MSIDIEALFRSLAPLIGGQSVPAGASADQAGGEAFRAIMASLVRFDHVVIFAYHGSEPPIELYSTFDDEEKVVYVSLYQAGPYLLDPFYHTARSGRDGVFRMRELAPDRFFSSEYYRSYYMQTGLAEEVGLFVSLGDDVTIVLSLMRKEKTGAFPAAELSILRKAEPLVAAHVRHAWPGLADRFADMHRQKARRGGDGSRAALPSASKAEAVWHDLKLTGRETAIIDLVLQGHSSESIGLKLGISTGTVKVHRRNVYRKLGISSQTQLLSIYLKTFS